MKKIIFALLVFVMRVSLAQVIPILAPPLMTVQTHTMVMKKIFYADLNCIKSKVSRYSSAPLVVQLAKSGCLDQSTASTILLAYQMQVPANNSLEYKKFIGETERVLYKPKTHQSVVNSLIYLDQKYPQYKNSVQVARSIFYDGQSTIYNPNWYPNTPMARKKIDWGDVAWADLKGGIFGGINGAIASSVANLIVQLLD